MSSSLNPDLVFQHAIAEHIAAIQDLCAQQAVLERIAGEMTRAILEGKKCFGAAMGEVRQTLSIWPRN